MRPFDDPPTAARCHHAPDSGQENRGKHEVGTVHRIGSHRFPDLQDLRIHSHVERRPAAETREGGATVILFVRFPHLDATRVHPEAHTECLERGLLDAPNPGDHAVTRVAGSPNGLHFVCDEVVRAPVCAPRFDRFEVDAERHRGIQTQPRRTPVRAMGDRQGDGKSPFGFARSVRRARRIVKDEEARRVRAVSGPLHLDFPGGEISPPTFRGATFFDVERIAGGRTPHARPEREAPLGPHPLRSQGSREPEQPPNEMGGCPGSWWPLEIARMPVGRPNGSGRGPFRRRSPEG